MRIKVGDIVKREYANGQWRILKVTHIYSTYFRAKNLEVSDQCRKNPHTSYNINRKNTTTNILYGYGTSLWSILNEAR